MKSPAIISGYSIMKKTNKRNPLSNTEQLGEQDMKSLDESLSTGFARLKIRLNRRMKTILMTIDGQERLYLPIVHR